MPVLEDPRNEAKDSLHILPLSIIPLETAGLRKMRLVKNARMEGVVEVFSGTDMGSGQVTPDQLYEMFDFGGKRHTDVETVKSLSILPSYDVYSLRIELRKLDIDVDRYEHLQLSKDKVVELSSYMREFVRPLVVSIYGEGREDVASFADMMKLFADPDVEKARENLTMLAEGLSIGIRDIPKFLNDYGDTYLCLAYYNSCLDQITPLLEQFLSSVREIKSRKVYWSDRQLMNTCVRIESRMLSSQESIASILGIFKIRTQDMWENLSAASFRQVKDLITSYQIRIGASLCVLSVKMNAWFRMFSGTGGGTLDQKAKFIMSNMVHGLENLHDIPLSDTI